MNTIIIYATSIANIHPGNHGYRLSFDDPDDTGTPAENRTFIGGYDIPVAVEAPEGWAVAETNCEEKMLFDDGGNAMAIEWDRDRGVLLCKPALFSGNFRDAKKQGYAFVLKAKPQYARS